MKGRGGRLREGCEWAVDVGIGGGDVGEYFRGLEGNDVDAGFND